MARYVWRDGDFRDKATGEPMLIPERDGVCLPLFVISDHAEPYRSVVTGRIIQGRAAHREEVAIAADKGLVPFERINGHPGGLINEKFAARGGRKTSEAAKEWAANEQKKRAVKTDARGAVIAE
jgi:hypothetical protein